MSGSDGVFADTLGRLSSAFVTMEDFFLTHLQKILPHFSFENTYN